ncbi:hypothetical protein ACH9L7_15285 [Haloferax sp. S1W]|uniref:hypothetical protein n=1 Tax=Haloferax sp. S1W TaxID=3377110 RepID=UPI0037CA466B
MVRRGVFALLAALVALSLVAAPATMADWGEQAVFSVERIDESQVREETPVLQYDSLPADAQDAVRNAIESPDGSNTVYGAEDWPDQFFYSDYSAPGNGLYAVVYEGQHYRLYTYAGGGFPFVYWLYELPFVVYGVALAWVASRTHRGSLSPQTAALATAPGVAFHLLGPEFDFPLLDPMQFIGLGVAATVVLGVGLAVSVRGREDASTE